MGTKNKPGKFDCYSNAEPDEPMFILLGRDPTASIIVSAWVGLRAALGHPEDHAKLMEATDCAQAMSSWAARMGKTQKVQRSIRVWQEMQAAQSIDSVRTVAGYLLDRADQYETRSPCWVALVDAAKNIMNMAHVDAEKNGDLDDDLMRRVDKMARADHKPIGIDPTAGIDD